jgi:hypothetical protein
MLVTLGAVLQYVFIRREADLGDAAALRRQSVASGSLWMS